MPQLKQERKLESEEGQGTWWAGHTLPYFPIFPDSALPVIFTFSPSFYVQKTVASCNSQGWK